MKSYGQYCPISRTAELLGDRWTIHIVRDLLTGTNRFNELIRGNPGLSRALLTRRLRQLMSAGVVERHDDGSYQLTESGRALEPVVFGLINELVGFRIDEESPATSAFEDAPVARSRRANIWSLFGLFRR